ncbi:hypothetical protein [uncultured Pseudodesulfovibrio sp.]|uniref:hypothetical protein n=1 Tax=uncultured Pseudodesulfovibrio sp. TaxID=2035858 RepID=UPI0029C77A08|nr:hypothetical protein [uncultured Pseudodesulfovibrio sp.]
MPAGRKNICETCYWQKLLEKRTRLDCAAFSSPIMASHFKAFGKWLGSHTGFHKASLTIHRYLPFFKDIELKWGKVPNYQALLSAFGAQGLRRQLLPMKWLEENELIQIDLSLKSTTTEKRRIQNILDSVKNDSAKYLIEYYDFLKARYLCNKISLRSLRLALCPAAKLILTARDSQEIMPVQKDLNCYLKNVPGQRNSISGFIRFLNDNFQANLALPPKTARAALNKKQKSRKELVQLLINPNESLKYRKRLLGVALNYFHGLPLTLGEKLLQDIERMPSGETIVHHKGHNYWLPEELQFLL